MPRPASPVEKFMTRALLPDVVRRLPSGCRVAGLWLWSGKRPFDRPSTIAVVTMGSYQPHSQTLGEHARRQDARFANCWWFPVLTLLIGYGTKYLTDWVQYQRIIKRERENRESD